MGLLLFHAVLLVYAVPCLVSSALISQGKVVTSSSQHQDWAPSRIVDGDYRRNGDTCLCCAATDPEYNPWFQLDLGQTYTIHSIEILGRNETNGQHLEGMRVLLKSVDAGFDDEETYVSAAIYEFNYDLSFAKSSRYVSLVLYDRTRYFTVCELSVYGDCQSGEFGDRCQYKCYCEGDPCNETGVCPSGKCQAGYEGLYCDTDCSTGFYGSGCTDECGFCANNQICYRTNGSCPSTCAWGFQGEKCKKECENGKFGSGCSERCGFCFENAVCYKNNGTCPGKCAAGYKEYFCKEKCSHHTYGMDCNETCGSCFNDSTCLHTNGTCSDGCRAGFTGDLCKTECMDGRYGPGCTSDCGTCLNGSACNKMSGICDAGCGPGYQEPYCKKACSNGFYGDGCRSSCGKCKIGTVCNNVDGTCDGGCSTGYMPGLCVEECEDGNHGEDCAEVCGQCLDGDSCDKFNGSCQSCVADYGGHDCKTYIKKDDSLPTPGVSSQGGAIGGAVGGATVVIVVIIITVVIVRRRKNKKYANELTDTFTNVNKVDGENSNNDETDSIDHKTKAQETKPSDGDEETYYEFLVRKTDLKICQLWDYIYQKKKYDNVLFHQEFNRLVSGLLMPHDTAMLPKHRSKNRYRAMCAYDHNRVPLKPEEDGESEYINASYINGTDKLRKFIASQGPTKDMRTDFLRMVWQHNIKQIVMLTNLVEPSGEKCLIYWPEKDLEQFGNITLKLESEDSTTDYIIRKLKIRQKEEDWRVVTQYHFKAWPDKDVPEATWPLIKLWRRIMDDAKENTVPILVHCSAGIGRTGTFIALDNAFNQATSEGTVRMLDLVTSLREQRVNMVQTRDQYVFLHEALADTLLFGTHFIWSRDYQDVYKYLAQVDPDTMKLRLQTQYALIVESMEERRRIQNETNSSTDAVYSNIYIHNQNTESAISIDEYRPKSKKCEHFKELDAYLLPSFDEKLAFIVTKSPTLTTRERYISLIIEQNVKTVVTLYGTTSVKDKKRVDLAEMLELGTKYGLELIEETNRDSYRQKQFRYDNNGENVLVCQFEFLAWKHKQPVPDDHQSMLNFLEAILHWQQRLSDHHPLLVHGSDGFERSGMTCVLLNELERMKRDEGHINIVETVKLMKERKENIIPNFEQYKFVHEAILKLVCKEDESIYETPEI